MSATFRFSILAWRAENKAVYELKWRSQGPKISEADVVAVEVRIGFPLPPQYRSFLLNVVNGGSPAEEPVFPIQGLPPETIMILHGINGICPEINYLDLEESLSAMSEYFDVRQAFTVGYDPLNGQVVIRPNGEVCWRPWDMITEPLETSTFHVADSFDEFIAGLEPTA